MNRNYTLDANSHKMRNFGDCSLGVFLSFFDLADCFLMVVVPWIVPK